MTGWIKALLLALLAGASAAAASFPLSVAPGGRYLVDAQGAPVLLQADSPWGLIVALGKNSATRYLDDRQARGFNAILVNLIENFAYDVSSWSDAPKNREGEAPFLKAGDFSTPNERYFAHADWVIDQAAARGMIVLLVPAFLGFPGTDKGWHDEYVSNGPEKSRDYGRYLGRRYKDRTNILWVMYGDRNPDDAAPMAEAMAEGIHEVAPHQLMTAHFQRGHSARSYLASSSWMTINTAYTNDIAQTQCLEEYARAPAMPFLLIEARYENEHGSLVSDQRRQAYTALLCGAMGHSFGNLPLWKFDNGWIAALDSPGARHMAHLRALFLSRPWHELVPDAGHALVASPGEGKMYVAAARTRTGDNAIVYLPVGGAPVTVDLAQVSGKQLRVWWFNPRTGSAALIGDLDPQGTRRFTPPDREDWVLVLDDVAARFATPGAAPRRGF